jgi:hypothetical protein
MSLDQFKKDLRDALFGPTPEGSCVKCKQPFVSGTNVFTAAGARETKISGMCEVCWDDMFKKKVE